MAYNPAPEGTYEVSGDGGSTWKRIFNITNFAFSGGDREETTTDTLDEGSIVSVGPARQKDVAISANANPGTEGYQILFNGYKDETKVQVRVTTESQVIYDNAVATDTIAIAVTGVATGGGNTKFMTNANRFKLGRAIVINSVAYVIEKINSENSANVYRADGEDIVVVAATQSWDVVDFGVRYTEECEVLNAGNPDLSPGSPFADTFSLKTTGKLTPPTYILT